MRIEHRNLDGTLTVTDDGLPDPPPYVDPEIAALREKVATLEAAQMIVAKRAGMTDAEAAALVAAKVVVKGG